MRVPIDRIDATLRVQGRIIVREDLSHPCDVIGFCPESIETRTAQDLVFAAFRSDSTAPIQNGWSAVNANSDSRCAPGPHSVWSLASATVKKQTRGCVMVIVLAVPAHQMDLARELVVKLDIKLGRGCRFDDRRVEIIARVVDGTRGRGKRILSVQRVPDRAHHALGNYFRAIR